MQTPPTDDRALALVLGGTGGIGSALVQALRARGETVLAVGRRTEPSVDLAEPASIERLAAHVAQRLADEGRALRTLIVASGLLHEGAVQPERGWQHLDAQALQRLFAVNAIGPALVMRHLLPLLPRQGRCVAAFLSARVGSIGDNRLGGWYGYRASKAALNQFVHTAAIELARRNKAALCVALHPGTVDTALSAPFAKTGLEVRPPALAAQELLRVIDTLPEGASGGFFDHHGTPVPW
ncbi:MAG: SDR family NAD(P)-dependent oxidoreductase [Hydrogenophaga sp.]|uniref:SDR family NAD(P)-dependent oxidoreductase n=1 Tax=Hydrogenophaga sp. TaxID=1904254 RepID=UPI00257EB950|nr:SDR family NAD(P)-dependent oxidoreductase [Hydrogenophaga sp.]MBL0944980.1 SDR family NAD(P)-dependent oxidoreductase [Hydrogenophaga sp.]